MRHTGLFILSFIGDKNSNIPSFLSTFWCPLFFFLIFNGHILHKKRKKYHFHIIIENMIWKKNCSGGESNPRSFSYGAKVQTTTPTGLTILSSLYERAIEAITFLKISIFFLHFVKNTKSSNTLWPNFFTSMLSDVYSMPTTKHFFCKLLQKNLKSKNVTWGTK